MRIPHSSGGGPRQLVYAVIISLIAALVAVANPVGAQSPVMCGGEVATIVGTPGDETIIGTPGNDVIAALQGNDIVKGAGGDDIICGGIGNDQLFGGDGFDVIYGAQGNDLLVSARSKTAADTAGSRMFGGADNDEIHGSTGWDRMQGGPGSDKLYGYTSRDWLRGGPGNDIVDGGAWIDDMNGGLGRDQVFVEGADLAKGGAGTHDTCVMVSGYQKATTAGCAQVIQNPTTFPPGSLGNINMGRANWTTGYLHAEVVRQLLIELGYTVTEPARLEFGPDNSYRAMASGEMDFWANTWTVYHERWWNEPLPNGVGTINGKLTQVGPLIPAGGLQGYLVTKSWAEANGITTIDQINANPALAAQLPDTNGNGVGEIFTCPRDWTCDDIAASNFAFAGWDNLEPGQSSYEAMFTQFLDRVDSGQAAIMYTWAPTDYYARAGLGVDTMWISMNNSSVLDDSNPLGLPGGEDYSQRRPGIVGYQGVDAATCLQGPDGCQLGWLGTDIDITANSDWLAANPKAAELFRQMRFSLEEISELLVEYYESPGTSSDVERVARTWIAQHRLRVNAWLSAAGAAN